MTNPNKTRSDFAMIGDPVFQPPPSAGGWDTTFTYQQLAQTGLKPVFKLGIPMTKVTPSEAFAARAAGAHALKFFPAEAGSPAVIKALRAVLPRDVPVLAVGGMTPEGIAAWAGAGADGFGLGSSLFRPGMTIDDVAAMARRFVAALPNGNGAGSRLGSEATPL